MPLPCVSPWRNSSKWRAKTRFANRSSYAPMALKGLLGTPRVPVDNSRPKVDVCQARGIAVQALAVVPMEPLQSGFSCETLEHSLYRINKVAFKVTATTPAQAHKLPGPQVAIVHNFAKLPSQQYGFCSLCPQRGHLGDIWTVQ